MLASSLRALRRLAQQRPPAPPGSLQQGWEAAVSACSLHEAAPAEERSGHLPGAGGAAAAAGGKAGDEAGTPDRVAKVIAHSFHRAPKDTANALMRELSELDRIHLVLALQRHTSKAKLQQQEAGYVEDLMKAVSRAQHPQHNRLTKQQVHNAVIYQRLLQKFASVTEDPPTLRQLSAVGLASGLPFLAFGFLDNGIMLVAGEQIDHLFGAKMGLTVLASAGLGNMVADVVGVSATHSIQENLKRVYRPPRLSMLQQQAVPFRAAQFIGAAAGVAIGCLLGMVPLLFMEPGFFVKAADAAAAVADAAAAATAAVQDAAAAGGSAAASDVADAAAAAAAAAAERPST